ncbi:hypothetical protein AB0B66_11980 [Catellatospora sp. NPDC049111]|uniref:hypothetical protein n=1 Tax=Catellatospora sp. NPDC049111 TaxID=3155271 RepID=UPI0033CD542A
MGSAWSLSVEAARWALRFYAAHWPLVLGLSLIPSLQRFMVINYGDRLPAGVGPASEVLTAGVRILLVYLILRIAAVEAGWSHLGVGERWQRVGQGVDGRMRDFLLQLLVLGIAFVVFDVLPETAISLWAPEERKDLLQAILVSVKNPTVIAMTILWMVGVGHQLAASRLDDLARV